MSLITNNLYPAHICLTVMTEADWEASNPVLMAGEIAVCTDCRAYITGGSSGGVRFKSGDGVTAFVSLPFADSLLVSKLNDLECRLASAEAFISQYEALAESQLLYLNSWTSKLEKEEGFN